MSVHQDVHAPAADTPVPDPWDTVAAEWVTRPEAAAMLSASPNTLKNWAQRGFGPTPYKLGGRVVRYRRAEVAAWLLGRPSPQFADRAGH